MSTYSREYYLKHRDRIIETTKKWQQNNKEKMREHNKQYRQKMKEKIEMQRTELRVMKATCEGFREAASIWESKAVELDVENRELRRQLALKNHVTKKKKLTLDDMLCWVLLAMMVAFIIFVICVCFNL